MRITMDELENYAGKLEAGKDKVEFEAKLRVGLQLKQISRTTNFEVFKKDVEWFEANFPNAALMISYIETRRT